MPEPGGKIDLAIITKIADKIADLETFKATINTRKHDEEFGHGFNAIRMFDSIVIQSAYFDKMTNSTEYYLYDEHTDTLREATEMEDTFLREAELGDYPWLDLDDIFGVHIEYIIGRNWRNEVERGDVPYDDTDHVKPTPGDIEDARRFWARVARENGWYKEPFCVQIWYDKRTGKIKDSVSGKRITEDVLIGE